MISWCEFGLYIWYSYLCRERVEEGYLLFVCWCICLVFIGRSRFIPCLSIRVVFVAVYPTLYESVYLDSLCTFLSRPRRSDGILSIPSSAFGKHTIYPSSSQDENDWLDDLCIVCMQNNTMISISVHEVLPLNFPLSFCSSDQLNPARFYRFLFLLSSTFLLYRFDKYLLLLEPLDDSWQDQRGEKRFYISRY